MKKEEYKEVRLVSEDGEYITDLKLSADDITRLVDVAYNVLKSKGEKVDYEETLTEQRIIELLQIAIVYILKKNIEENTKNKQKTN